MRNHTKKAPTLTLLAVAAAAILVCLQSCAGAGTLLDDMQHQRKALPSEKQENLDVVVQKHVSVGTPLAVGVALCESNGFKTSVYQYRKRPNDAEDFDHYVFCSYMRRSWLLITAEEYRAILYVKDGLIQKASGRYFLHGI